MKVAICHEHIFIGDAVGNDIVGMAEVLIELGIETFLIGKNIAKPISRVFSVIENFENLNLCQFEILIYHHSTYWEKGKKLLENFSGSIIFKYHNITPEHFYKPYSKIYYEHCMRGRMQTLELISDFPNASWLADSEYNRLELIHQNPKLIASKVVPPFHKHEFVPSKFCEEKKKPTSFLFVGRIAPNKGHKVLIRVFNQYLRKYNAEATLEIIGGTDPNLKKYENQIIELINDLGISSHVCWQKNLTDSELKGHYRNANVFLCFSEHEGFCVPLIESQSIGLPVLSTDTSAIGETLGPDQLIEEFPSREVDYLFYAKVLNEMMINTKLRKEIVEKGYANFLSRFSRERISDCFVESILSSLMESAKE
jgi:glycosyltransferase involved in cell wall biosynthesis